jgi:uncharacterized protein YdhG (YjbR/CyaY superfamily)
MQSKATTVKDYILQLPAERKEVVEKLRTAIKDNLPIGFKECMSYGMVGYVVPHSLYPKGYHCNPKLPLPFINIASQKNFIAVYHMGIYSHKPLHDWFLKEYPKYCSQKLDMGKSCIRFKKMELVPFSLFGQLAKKISVKEWIEIWEKLLEKR